MNNPYISLLRICYKYLGSYRTRFKFTYCSFLLIALIHAFRPWLYGWFVNSLLTRGREVLSIAWIYVVVFFFTNILELLIRTPAKIAEKELAFNLGKNYLFEKFRRILQLPLTWHENHHSGAIISEIKRAHDNLLTFFQNGFTYFQTLTKFIFSFAAILYFSPLFGSISLCFGIVLIFIVVRIDKPLIHHLRQTHEKENQVSASLFDILSNIITVVTLRLEKRTIAHLDSEFEQVRQPYHKYIRLHELKWTITDFFVALIFAVITIGYVLQHHNYTSEFYVGGLVTLLGYVFQFNSVFYDITWQYNHIIHSYASVKAAQDIERDWSNPDTLRDGGEKLPKWQSMYIDHLNFSYHEEKRTQTLHNISMKLEKGQSIAIIGESGSGKSTLMKVLRGLYSNSKGSIRVQNRVFDNLQPLEDVTTLFPQEPEIFDNTIRYNITLGLPIDEETLEAVCEVAHLSEVVKHLPEGMELKLNEKGAKLSGGQRQRLALARGILAAKSSEIILLDEPTSSVDLKTEALIYAKLFREFRDKVIVCSVHRLDLLKHFDYIYLLDNGSIVGEGTFASLGKENQHFQNLWSHRGVH